jgi:hypothetical protein
VGLQEKAACPGLSGVSDAVSETAVCLPLVVRALPAGVGRRWSSGDQGDGTCLGRRSATVPPRHNRTRHRLALLRRRELCSSILPRGRFCDISTTILPKKLV